MEKPVTFTDREIAIIRDALCARRRQIENALSDLPGNTGSALNECRSGLCKMENKILGLLNKQED